MDIDQLLKSKSPKEKMDFLNSMRCTVVLPTEILGQGVDQIPLQKYDVIKAKIGPCEHYKE